MSKLDEMRAIAELNGHRETLLAEVRDAWQLTTNALTRLEKIQAMLQGEHAEVLGPMWGGAMSGDEGEEPLTQEDIGSLVATGMEFVGAVAALHAKRPIFGLPTQ